MSHAGPILFSAAALLLGGCDGLPFVRKSES